MKYLIFKYEILSATYILNNKLVRFLNVTLFIQPVEPETQKSANKHYANFR